MDDSGIIRRRRLQKELPLPRKSSRPVWMKKGGNPSEILLLNAWPPWALTMVLNLSSSVPLWIWRISVVCFFMWSIAAEVTSLDTNLQFPSGASVYFCPSFILSSRE
ncbi:hypothetical protein Z043_119196, partial [Scleropages formosus]